MTFITGDSIVLNLHKETLLKIKIKKKPTVMKYPLSSISFPHILHLPSYNISALEAQTCFPLSCPVFPFIAVC